MKTSKPDFMNGIPELLVLRLLSTREMYGYELVQFIRQQTGNAIELSEGVVYPTLHALEIEGALKSRRKRVNGRSRIYYSVTKIGSLKLARIAGAWSDLAAVVSGVLHGGRYASAV